MEGLNCGGEGGWTRVAYINMTEPGATCPQEFTQKDFSVGLTLCENPLSGCAGSNFTTLGINYREVCGRLRGYQNGETDAFIRSTSMPSPTIDSQYLDGVSITYGSNSCKHIWTYAAGISSESNPFANSASLCPCNNGSTQQIPAFVGNDYYCESGVNTFFIFLQLFSDDPLWDGQDCPATESTMLL